MPSALTIINVEAAKTTVMSPGRLLPQLVLELAAGPGEVAPHAHPGHHLLAPEHAVLLPDLSWSVT